MSCAVCFFLLQKLANYHFSEACCEVGAELEHMLQQFQLDIVKNESIDLAIECGVH
jgi:hypothetical protein